MFPSKSGGILLSCIVSGLLFEFQALAIEQQFSDTCTGDLVDEATLTDLGIEGYLNRQRDGLSGVVMNNIIIAQFRALVTQGVALGRKTRDDAYVFFFLIRSK